MAKRRTPRRAAHGLMARRRGPGDPPQRKMIPASWLHIAGGYSPLTTARLWPTLSLSSTTPCSIRWEPGSPEQFDRMPVSSMLETKPCPFWYRRPLPRSRWPYAQLGHCEEPLCPRLVEPGRSSESVDTRSSNGSASASSTCHSSNTSSESVDMRSSTGLGRSRCLMRRCLARF